MAFTEEFSHTDGFPVIPSPEDPGYQAEERDEDSATVTYGHMAFGGFRRERSYNQSLEDFLADQPGDQLDNPVL